MSWTDRDFNLSKHDRRWAGNPAWQALAGALPVGTWFGVRVRLHASLFWFAAGVMLWASAEPALGWKGGLMGLGILLPVLLLHEWGHCWVSRRLGGSPEEILLWPLGGLSLAGAPQRAAARLLIALGGPLVNALLCGATLGALLLMGGGAIDNVSNPPLDFSAALAGHGLVGCLWGVLIVSGALLLVNLLPILPLDGGQVVQAILWRRLGYSRSMNVACMIGLLGAIGLGTGSLGMGGVLPSTRWPLIFLAGALFFLCLKQKRLLRHSGAAATSTIPSEIVDDREDDFSGHPHPPRPRHKLSRRLMARARRRARQDQADLERIDLILDKVSTKGMRSLSFFERRALHKATRRRRRGDEELQGSRRNSDSVWER